MRFGTVPIGFWLILRYKPFAALRLLWSWWFPDKKLIGLIVKTVNEGFSAGLLNHEISEKLDKEVFND